MWRCAILTVATLMLLGAAEPGGLSRQGMPEHEVQRLAGTQFAADCAVYMHYRAAEEPDSPRGRKTAEARDALYAITMARNPKIKPAGMAAEAAKASARVRERLLSGELTILAFDSAFSLCDREFRLGVVEAWDILVEGADGRKREYYGAPQIVELCGGMYRHVAAEYRTAPGGIAQAAAEVAPRFTVEYARRTRRPMTEAEAIMREKERGMTRAAQERRIEPKDVKWTVEHCDEKFALNVGSHAVTAATAPYRPKPETPQLREACIGLLRQTSAQAGTAVDELKAIAGGSSYARAKVAAKLCGIYSDGHRVSKQLGCPTELVETMNRSRMRAEDTLAEFNGGSKVPLRCEQTQ
ncbi:hypothetical protein GVN21_19285 [Caulobacter sp. SLTY]|uniref:hypothetical protein n=1 Tax=Caulobacter sp. SLTY TaxID=2683262 RepID=UPI0014124393|nr:hypothetical protein [Caulobacter sp. SLTY]NBB17510.1 hypothetical protein [Caulobacter sp. SLTY]